MQQFIESQELKNLVLFFLIHTLLGKPKNNMDVDLITKIFDHLKEKIKKADDLRLRSLN